MAVMEKLKMFVVQEPVVAASCLIAGFGNGVLWCCDFFCSTGFCEDRCNLIDGLFLPAVVRPIIDSLETSKPVPQPAISDVVTGVTGKK